MLRVEGIGKGPQDRPDWLVALVYEVGAVDMLRVYFADGPIVPRDTHLPDLDDPRFHAPEYYGMGAIVCTQWPT